MRQDRFYYVLALPLAVACIMASGWILAPLLIMAALLAMKLVFLTD